MSDISLAEFADRIEEMMPIIARESMKQDPGEFYKLKLTMPQFVILCFLSRQGEVKMSDIAQHTNVTTAAMTGIVGRLVRDGYVIRVSDPKDRRIIRIRLTTKGSRLVDKITQHRRHTIMNIFGKISQKERQDYLKILEHIKRHILEERH